MCGRRGGFAHAARASAKLWRWHDRRFVCCSCFRAGDQGEQDHGNQKCERAEPLRNRQRAPNNSLNIATQEFDKVQAKRIARCQHKNRNSVRELIPLDELQQAEEKNRQKALV